MYEIFEKLLQDRGITAYRFCKDTGVSSSTISTWKKKNSKIGIELAEIISNYFNVTIDYVINGETNINKTENTFEARNDTERQLLVLCRKAGDITPEEKEAILKNFESSIDIYLKAKGIKKE